MTKILVVDDDKALGNEVADGLRAEHYLVDIAHDGRDARGYFGAAQYDLIILDWELPDANGPELCHQIRSSKMPSVPILFLTARGAVADKATGFNSGADDYLTKPFHMIELKARVKALLRRPPILQSRQIVMRNIVLNMDRLEVILDGEKIELFPKEYALLEFLMTNPNKIFTVDALLQSVWATDSESSLDTVRVTLMRIRQKLKLTKEWPLIVTMRNIGYRLEP